MTNTDLLKHYISYSGIKLNVLAYKIGVGRTTLWSRLNDHSEFTQEEIKDISKVLVLSDEQVRKIFN